MAFEEEFEIAIPDEAAAEMRRVGDVVDYVCEKIAPASGTEGALLRWVDRQFQRVTGRTVSGLPPETKVVDLLMRGRKKHQWAELGVLPPLERPLWARLCVPVGLLLVCGLVFSVCARGSGWALTGLFWMIIFAPIPYFLFSLLSFFAASIPEPELTIGELLVCNKTGAPRSPRDFISDRVKIIVSEQLSVPLMVVREERLFIEDLGME